MKPNQPTKVRLTEDYLNLHSGVGFPVDTILIRSPHGTGQYAPEGTKLGQDCVACFDEIESICIPID